MSNALTTAAGNPQPGEPTIHRGNLYEASPGARLALRGNVAGDEVQSLRDVWDDVAAILADHLWDDENDWPIVEICGPSNLPVAGEDDGGEFWRKPTIDECRQVEIGVHFPRATVNDCGDARGRMASLLRGLADELNEAATALDPASGKGGFVAIDSPHSPLALPHRSIVGAAVDAIRWALGKLTPNRKTVSTWMQGIGYAVAMTGVAVAVGVVAAAM